jgi:GT2 family glycosyltransferase
MSPVEAGLSVIIPCRADPLLGQTVRRILEQARALGVDDVEVLVVGDAVPAEIPVDSRVRWINPGTPLWPAANRNRGLTAASGATVVFLDADCLPQPGWLDQIRLSRSESAVIRSGAIVLPTNSWIQACYNLAGFREYLAGLPQASRRSLPSFCLWGPRRAFLSVGGFDESLPTAEDLDFSVRLAQAGWRLEFDPRVRVCHQPTATTVAGLLRRGYRHGSRSIQVRRRYPGVFGAPPWSTWPLTLATLSPAISAVYLLRTLRDSVGYRAAVARCAVPIFLYRIAWCLGAATGVRPRQYS